MTPDTRTPEQRREDERSLAHVARVAAHELAVAQTRRERAEQAQLCSCGHDHDPAVDFCIYCPCPDRTPEQERAYEAGKAAGLAGWTHKGQAGMASHEQSCADAYRDGVDAEWRAGYSEGDELRKMEQGQ